MRGNDEQAKKDGGEPRKFSKFNDLSVAIAFGVSGLAVVYLPGYLNKSIDWMIEGRILGIILAVLGAAFTLLAAAKLTGRDGFGSWGIATLTGALMVGLIAIVREYRLPALCAIVLINMIIGLLFVVIYAVVAGFTSFFDEQPPEDYSGIEARDSDESLLVSTDKETRKKLTWYERVTLLVAVISTIATVAAVIEPIIHS